MSGKPRLVKTLSPWRRLAAAAYAAPHEGKIYGTIEIDAGEALAFLERKKSEGVRLTVTHLVARAAALSLREDIPDLNRMVSRGRVYQRRTVDLFMTVGINDGRDISGFKIEAADTKTLDEIAQEIRDGAAGLRGGNSEMGLERTRKVLEAVPAPLLRPVLLLARFLLIDLGLDLKALGVKGDPFGSLLVTNVGTYGLAIGYPALLPLSAAACVVAIGQVGERAVVRDGQVVARPILPLSATLDHRIADAYHAGVLAKAVDRRLQTPETL
jgi:pyruvate dehydrogenase E2 component (dihydrolipoamide acetyltransferase)